MPTRSMNLRFFVDELARTALSKFGATIVIVSVVAALAGFFGFDSTSQVPLGWVVLLCVALLFAMLVFGRTALTLSSRLPQVSVAVTSVARAPSTGHDAGVAMLVLPSKIPVEPEDLVSVYTTLNDIDQVIGVGRVLRSQRNGSVLVLVEMDVIEGDCWEKIISNEVSSSAMYVRMSIPPRVLDWIVANYSTSRG